MGFKPTIRAFERAKTVHALDRAAVVIGRLMVHTLKMFSLPKISKFFIAFDIVCSTLPKLFIQIGLWTISLRVI
jgi:hypothetical protein